MTVCILIIAALAVMAPLLHRVLGSATHWLLGLICAGIAVWLGSHFPALADGAVIQESISWVPSLGINLDFRAGGVGLLLAVLVTGVGALILIYSGGYLHGNPQLGAFYAYLLFFMTSMLGLALADNLILLFVFWELTSVSSYFLIGFEHERYAARWAALQALLITALGGLAMLAGFVLLGQVGGALSVSELAGQAETLREHSLYVPILLLILLGAATKSAQFPFHFWLPNAMQAPSPVSAYLHSATMVKAGVFLMARLTPVLGGTDGWQNALTVMGLITMLLGAVLSFTSVELKRILAYSTISVLGVLTMLLGVGTPQAVQAAMVYLAAHAGYKGALFMIAGSMAHATHETNAEKIGGLRKAMPYTAAAALLAAISMAGLPPLFGFVGKESLYAAVLHADRFAILLTAAAVAAHILLLVVAIRVGIRPFWSMDPSTEVRGEPRTSVRAVLPETKVAGGASKECLDSAPHEAPLSVWLAPLLAGVFGLMAAFLTSMVGRLVIGPAVASVHPAGEAAVTRLSFWHGLTPELGLSALTVAAGILLFAARNQLLRRVQELLGQDRGQSPHRPGLAGWTFSRGYDAAIGGLNWLAKTQTRVLQSGYLRWYVLTVLIVTIALAAPWLIRSHREFEYFGGPEINFHELVVAAMILISAVCVVRSRTRLAAVASLGAVGYGVALLFVFFGAPDLAMTQFLIETLLVILFVLVIYHLPPFAVLSGRRARLVDAVVASAFGAMMFGFTLSAMSAPAGSRLMEYFAQNSVPGGHGRNVVNVILVDFRAMDTLGEITVLAVAAIGVVAMLRLRPRQFGDPK